MRRERLIMTGKWVAVFLAGAMLAVGTDLFVRWAQYRWSKEGREWFAVKAVNSTMSLDILPVIRRQKTFCTAQVLAMIQIESDGNAKKVSKKGAVGLMQVMPKHAENAGLAVDDLFDPEVNVRLGLKVWRAEHKKFKGVEYHSVSAYNCGEPKWKEILAGKRAISKETANHWRKYRVAKRRYEDWIERGEWRERE